MTGTEYLAKYPKTSSFLLKIGTCRRHIYLSHYGWRNKSDKKTPEHFKWVKIRPPCKKQHRIAVNPLAARELKFSTGRTHTTWCLRHGNQTESTTFCSVLCFNWQRRSWERPRNGFGDPLHWECTDLFLMKAASTCPERTETFLHRFHGDFSQFSK